MDAAVPSKLGSAARHSAKAARWIVPGALIALMPKCPACFAAWIAVGTGLGLSMPAASRLRLAVLAVCFGTLCILLIRGVVSWRRGQERTRTCCH